jgi:hypothetical protein
MSLLASLQAGAQTAAQKAQAVLESPQVAGVHAAVAANVGRLSTHVAAAAQQLQQGDPPPGAGAIFAPPPAADWVRVPAESAKRLRYFANGDLGALVAAHVRDKQAVLDENAVLRRLLAEAGVGPQASAPQGGKGAEVRRTDDGVNRILVLAAQAEIEALRDELAHRVTGPRRSSGSASGEGEPDSPASPLSGGPLVAALEAAQAECSGLRGRALRAETEVQAVSAKLAEATTAASARASTSGSSTALAAVAAWEARAGAAEAKAAQQAALGRELAETADALNAALEAERIRRSEAESALKMERAAAADNAARLEERLSRAKRGASLAEGLPDADAGPAGAGVGQSLHAELAAARSALALAEDAAGRSREEAVRQGTRADALQAQVQALQSDVAASQAASAAKTAEVAALRGDLSRATHALGAATRDASQHWEARLRDVDAARASLAAQVASLEQEAGAARAASADVARLRDALSSAQEAASSGAAAHEALTQAVAARDAAERAVADMAAQVGRLEAAMAAAQGETATLRDLLAQERASAAHALASLSDQLRHAHAALRSDQPADWPDAARAAVETAHRAARESDARAAQSASEAQARVSEAEQGVRAALARVAAAEARMAEAATVAGSRVAALEAQVQASQAVAQARLADAEALDTQVAALAEQLRRQSACVPGSLQLEGVDVLYLRNVLIRLLEAMARADLDACAQLLPVIATLLQLPPQDFQRLSTQLCDAAAQARAAKAATGGGGGGGGGGSLLGASFSVAGYTLRM